MADRAEAQNPLDTWRQFITDSERQWNSFFGEVLGTEGASTALNTWVEASLTIQRMVADQLERYYAAFNIPSHRDLVELGARMQAIEESLARLERTVIAAEPSNRRAAPKAKPARTRKPTGVRPASKTGNGTG